MFYRTRMLFNQTSRALKQNGGFIRISVYDEDYIDGRVHKSIDNGVHKLNEVLVSSKPRYMQQAEETNAENFLRNKLKVEVPATKYRSYNGEDSVSDIDRGTTPETQASSSAFLTRNSTRKSFYKHSTSATVKQQQTRATSFQGHREHQKQPQSIPQHQTQRGSQKSEHYLLQHQRAPSAGPLTTPAVLIENTVALYKTVQTRKRAQSAYKRCNEQWKNVKQRSPEYSFYLSSAKKTIFEVPANQLDDECRYNNFILSSPDRSHTPSMEKTSWRNYRVFEQRNLNDLYYPQSHKQHDRSVFDSRATKCAFDYSKTRDEAGVVGRNFYNKQHPNDIPATQLEPFSVVAAKYYALPFKKTRNFHFDKIPSRETPPGSMLSCLVRQNQKPATSTFNDGTDITQKKIPSLSNIHISQP